MGSHVCHSSPRTISTHFHEVVIECSREPDPALDVEPERRFMATSSVRPASTHRGSGGPRRTQRPSSVATRATRDLTERCRPDSHARGAPGPRSHRSLNADRDGPRVAVACGRAPVARRGCTRPFLAAVDADLAGDDPSCGRSSWTASWRPASAHRRRTSSRLGLGDLCAGHSDHLSGAAAALARLAASIRPPRAEAARGPQRAWPTCSGLYWPQTAAPLQRRLRVLDGLRRDLPGVAWVRWHLLPTRVADHPHRHHRPAGGDGRRISPARSTTPR